MRMGHGDLEGEEKEPLLERGSQAKPGGKMRKHSSQHNKGVGRGREGTAKCWPLPAKYWGGGTIRVHFLGRKGKSEVQPKNEAPETRNASKLGPCLGKGRSRMGKIINRLVKEFKKVNAGLVLGRKEEKPHPERREKMARTRSAKNQYQRGEKNPKIKKIRDK